MKKKIVIPDTLSRLLAVLLIAALLSITCPNFLTVNNILNIFNQASLNVFIAIGMMMTMLIGGIDLSVGSVLAISSVLAARFFFQDDLVSIVLGILFAMLIGIACGLVNGTMVAVFKLPAFLVTFGMSQICRGFAYLYMNGKVFNGFSDSFKVIGKGRLVGKVQMPILISLVCLVLMAVFLKKSILGRQIYVTGANPSCAKYSGINTNKITMLCYAFSGMFAALAGVVYISRLDAAEATIGTSFANDAIAAAAIGGISFAGGKGNVYGTVIGAVLLTLIKNGMNQLGIATEYQKLVTGLVIIIAVLIDRKSAKIER